MSKKIIKSHDGVLLKGYREALILEEATPEMTRLQYYLLENMSTTTLTFDAKTISTWKESGIFAVRVGFVQSGCEGNRLSVEPIEVSKEIDNTSKIAAPNTSVKLENLESRITKEEITIYATKEDWEKIEGGRVTQVNGKWIFTSEKVKRRCGCGSSFSFDDTDKLVRDFPTIDGVTVLHDEVRGTLEKNIVSQKVNDSRNVSDSQKANVSQKVSDSRNSAPQIIIDLGDKKAEETIIQVTSGQSLKYRGFFPSGSKVRVQFVVENGAMLDARFFVSAEDAHAHVDIQANIIGSDTQAHIAYRVFAFDSADISVQTHTHIGENLSKIQAGIEGKNIFFSENARISGIPRVSAASDDIQAGHSLSFEQISEKDTFYLESRGLSPRQARKMLAESHIRTIFSDVPPEITEYLVKNAMQMLK